MKVIKLIRDTWLILLGGCAAVFLTLLLFGGTYILASHMLEDVFAAGSKASVTSSVACSGDCHDPIPQSEFGQLVAYLVRSGMKPSDVTAVIGNNPNGKTRGQVADELRAWVKNRPKR